MITGTPGVGKTEVSEKLAAKLGAIRVDIGDLVKKEGLSSSYDYKRQTLVADSERVAKRVHQIIAQTRKTVIVDGHYSTEIVAKSQVTKAFVLRCHPSQLKQRMSRHGFRGAKLRENVAAEILDVCLANAVANIGLGKVCEVDTTDKTVDAVVNEILSILERRKKCNVGIVDWLGQLEMEGTLDQHLKEF